MKKILAILLSFFSLHTLANATHFPEEPQDKKACVILFNVNENKLIEKHNAPRCAIRISSASTFKIPLSLMAFDQHIITPNTVFIWDKKNYNYTAWNQNQTPHTWLKNSVGWVSQEITSTLGFTKIKMYLKKLHYGNQNFSGNQGKNNDLTHTWPNSNLMISADEQLKFMRALVENKLAVSKQALAYTKINMYLETFPNGYKLYGQTGSLGGNGWFVGFAQKSQKKVIVIVNLENKSSTETAGIKAKIIAENSIKNL